MQAEVEAKVEDADRKSVVCNLKFPVDKNRKERFVNEHFGRPRYDLHTATAKPQQNSPPVIQKNKPGHKNLPNVLASQLTTFLLSKRPLHDTTYYI